MKKEWSFPIIILASAACITTLIALAVGGYLLVVRQTTTPSDEEQIRKEFARTMSQFEAALAANEKHSIVGFNIQGDWAIVDTAVVDKETGEWSVGEGTIVLFRKLSGRWRAAVPGTNTYESWIDEIPESLLPEDQKIWFR